MSENTLKAKILQLAGPAVGAQNLEIWGLEVIEAGRMLVRLYVDTPGRAEEEAPAETEDGDIPENISATVDQCASRVRRVYIYARPQKPGRGSRPGKAKKNSSSKAQKGKNS